MIDLARVKHIFSQRHPDTIENFPEYFKLLEDANYHISLAETNLTDRERSFHLQMGQAKIALFGACKEYLL